MRRITLTGLVLIWLAFAQVPKPFISGPVSAGASKLEGNFSPLPAGVAPQLELLVAGQSSPANFDVNLARGTFSASADKPFAAGEKISVRLTAAGAKQESDSLEVQKVFPPELLAIDAIYGASKITVRFKPVRQPAGKLSLNVQVDQSQEFPHTISADDAPKGTTDVTLRVPLFSNTNLPRVRVTPAVSSGEPGKAMEVEAAPAAVRVKGPLTEGDYVISGSTHPSVKRVCVAVFGGGLSGAAAEGAISRAVTEVRTCPDAGRRLFEQKVEDYGTKREAGKARTKSVAQATEKTPEILAAEELQAVAPVGGPLLEEQEVAVDAKTGLFEFKLSRPLPNGAVALVREVLTEGRRGPEVAIGGPDPIYVNSAGLDWGRVRGVFTVGAAIGQANESFGRADPYVGFYVDGPFFNHLIAKSIDPKTAPKVRDLFDNKPAGIALHWLAAVRLTQTGTVGEIGAIAPTLQQAQSAVFMAGLYAPIRFRGFDWVYRGTQYSAYFAPLGKIGVTALKDGVLLKRTTTSSVNKLNPCPDGVDCDAVAIKDGPKTTLTRSMGSAPFASYGLRLGVMSYEFMGVTRRNRQVAPDPVMYVDLMWGPNQAYTTPGRADSTKEVSDNLVARTRTTTTTKLQGFTFEPRFSAEARMKLPYIPAEVGVDINQNWKAPVAGIASASPDDAKIAFTDFRFVFGFRLDAAKSLFPIFAKKK